MIWKMFLGKDHTLTYYQTPSNCNKGFDSLEIMSFIEYTKKLFRKGK